MRVLFVGNSYQYLGGDRSTEGPLSPFTMFVRLAEQSGHEIVEEGSWIGGGTMQQHWQDTNGINARNELATGDYDLMIVNGRFDENVADFNFYSGLLEAEAESYGTQTIYAGLWAGDWVITPTSDNFTNRHHDFYSAAAINQGAGYAPIGLAYADLYQQLHQLYGQDTTGAYVESGVPFDVEGSTGNGLTYDGIHAGPLASYLSALVIYATTFGEPAPTDWAPTGISASEAALARAIAWAHYLESGISLPGVGGPEYEADNTIEGSDASDTINGTEQSDLIEGLDGDDRITGYLGDDILFGGNGRDLIDGREGNDILSTGGNTNGDSRPEYMRGRDGDDTYLITSLDYQSLILDETSGYDRVVFEDYSLTDMTGVYINASGYLAFDFVNGLGQNSNLTIRDYLNIEEFVFEDGTIITDVADILGVAATTTIDGTDAIDTLVGLSSNDIIYAFDGDDRLTGNAGNDSLYGGDGRDILDGGAGNDVLSAGGNTNGDIRAEYLRGRDGDDTYVITSVDYRPYILNETSGFDQVVFQDYLLSEISGASITAAGYLSIEFVNDLGQNGNLTIRDYENIEQFVFEDGTVVTDVNVLLDTSATVTLNGTEGDDTISGISSDDVIFGLGGNDLLIGNTGDDTIFGGDGRDNIDGRDGDDTLSTGGNTSGIASPEYLRGRDGNDTYLITDQDYRTVILSETSGFDRVVFEDHSLAEMNNISLNNNGQLVFNFTNEYGLNANLTIREQLNIEEYVFLDGTFSATDILDLI